MIKKRNVRTISSSFFGPFLPTKVPRWLVKLGQRELQPTFGCPHRIRSDWLSRCAAARAFARAASIFVKARRSSACATRCSCCASLASAVIGFQHTANNNKAAESNDKPRIEFSRLIDLSDGSKQCTPRNKVDSADYSHEIIVTNIF